MAKLAGVSTCARPVTSSRISCFTPAGSGGNVQYVFNERESGWTATSQERAPRKFRFVAAPARLITGICGKAGSTPVTFTNPDHVAEWQTQVNSTLGAKALWPTGARITGSSPVMITNLSASWTLL